MSADDDPAEIELLPLQACDIDHGTLRRLLFDIEHAAELTEVRARAKPGGFAEPVRPTLAEAALLLESGAASAIQLRYLAHGRAWCDTLLRTASGFRLVRAPEPSPRPR